MHSRREFFNGIPALGLFRSFRQAPDANRVPIKAVAFDAFAIFDARPVFSLVDELFPEHGKELTTLWRARQFEYRTFWANRQNQTPEELGVADIATGATLSDLVAYLARQPAFASKLR